MKKTFSFVSLEPCMVFAYCEEILGQAQSLYGRWQMLIHETFGSTLEKVRALLLNLP
jgi:hypothetical protein